MLRTFEHGGDASNYGWVITCQDSDGQWRNGIRFYSDDFTAGTWNRPSLSITIGPEPASLLLGLALPALTATRRRARPLL